LVDAVGLCVEKYDLKNICFFGISRGAWMCFRALACSRIPVGGAVLLSAPSFSRNTAAKLLADRMKEYLHKCFTVKTYKKILAGKINIEQIVRTLTYASHYNKRYYHENQRGFASACPLLFIYGQKDPIAADSRVFYSSLCQNYRIPHRIVEIANANHSYFHYKWKEEIFNITENWLIENIETGEKHAASS
jgi:hypothetical protein